MCINFSMAAGGKNTDSRWVQKYKNFMNLPNQVLAQVIGHTHLLSRRDHLRRHAGRIAVSKTAMLTVLGSTVASRVTIIDLSSGGVGLVHSAAIAVGNQFLLNIKSRMGDELEILCSVTGCKRTTTGRSRISAEFLQIVSDIDDPVNVGAADSLD